MDNNLPKFPSDEDIIKRYPNVNWPPSISGPDCGAGWSTLLWLLMSRIEAHNKELNEEYRIRVAQIKEKFGGLRFYTDRGESFPLVPEESQEEKESVAAIVFNSKSYRGCAVKNLSDVLRWKEIERNEIDGAISMAESLSFYMCESCGTTEDITTKGKGWIQTLCNTCRTKPKENKWENT